MAIPLRRLSLAALALSALAALPGLAAQSTTARSLGGGCGATIGYPVLLPSGWFGFRVQRSVCDPNAIAVPSVVVLGVQQTHVPIPFAPGFAPGCVWQVVPLASTWIPTTVGGQGSTASIVDLANIPRPITVYVQALVTCLAQGWREHSASDAWEVTFR